MHRTNIIIAASVAAALSSARGVEMAQPLLLITTTTGAFHTPAMPGCKRLCCPPGP